ANLSLPELIVQKDSDAFLLSWGSAPRPYRARRIGTTMLGELSRKLFYGGVSGLLEKAYQASLKEADHLVKSLNMKTQVVGTTAKLDFTGPLGVYFREVFLYIPMLLAEHQNARGDHASAEAWFSTVFDPTAPFPTGTDLAGMTASQRLQAERD